MERGGDGGLLYGGGRVRSTRGSLHDQRALPAADREFLGASRRLQRRQSRLRQSLVAALTVLALSLSVLAVIAKSQAEMAANQRIFALSEQLIAEVQVVSDPTISALLAEEAWHIAPTSQAASNLITAFTRINVTTLGGQTSPVTSLSFSPNGAVLTTTDTAGA